MRRSLLFIALVLGLVAASAAVIALRPAVLGLDLQGGVEVVLEGQPTEQAQVTDEAIARSVEIIRGRVDAFGVAEPEIQTQSNDQIAISLPGVDDPQRVVDDLIQPAQLAFFDFAGDLVGSPNGDPNLYRTVKRAQAREPEQATGRRAFYVFDRETKEPLPLFGGEPQYDRRDIADAFPDDAIPPDVLVESLPAGWFIAYQQQQLQTRDASAAGPRAYFLFQNRPALTGEDVTDANSQLQPGSFGGSQYIVTMQFTGEGRQAFADITRRLAQRGFLEGQEQSFAIVLDGEIVSNPTIDYDEYPTGIDGGNGAQIQGNFTQTESERLAKQINSGAIPIQLEVVSLKQVSATLGKESLRQGLIAGFLGLAVVLLFLVAYYRLLGVVAAAALLIYAVLLYAVVVLVPITLTLPGIAGIILTIGVASDANVVIFERVREEARAGRSARSAILGGYRKGIAAIIDANVVTLATAAILFLFATAGVKGFAFTLFIGVLLSLFTAVVATRAVFGVLADTRLMRDDRLMGLHQREFRWKMDFVGRWKLWYAISFLPVLLGSIFLFTNGLNLGLDFTGGTRIATTFERSATEGDVREVFAASGYPDARIQATTQTLDGQEVRGFQIQTETLQPDEQRTVTRALDDRFGVAGTPEVTTVGPTFGDQVVRNAIYAIVLSVIVLILYLTIRFEYKLAVPALFSVVHDVWLTVVLYSMLGLEVTSATVAALLTILGYSLYDVVIVFDRVRENVPLLRNLRYRDVVNRSIHEVLTRSLITSFLTLLPVLSLFLFGGATLRDFAVALLIGLLAGGVSSIVIAAPFAALWKEREPSQRRQTAKAERRARRIASDADVVDLDVLERAELGLQADLRAEAGEPAGLIGDGEAYDDEPAPAARPAAERADGAAAEPEDEPDGRASRPDGPVPAPVPDTGAEPTAASGDADGEGSGTPAGEPRAESPPERERRHRQVQRKRRR